MFGKKSINTSRLESLPCDVVMPPKAGDAIRFGPDGDGAVDGRRLLFCSQNRVDGTVRSQIRCLFQLRVHGDARWALSQAVASRSERSGRTEEEVAMLE